MYAAFYQCIYFYSYPVSNFTILYEIEPQHVCFATNNMYDLRAMKLPPVPYVGCLSRLELLRWNNQPITY